MGQIKVTKAPIEGLYIIEPTVHGDNRGYFMETYNRKHVHKGRSPGTAHPEEVSPGEAGAGDPGARF